MIPLDRTAFRESNAALLPVSIVSLHTNVKIGLVDSLCIYPLIRLGAQTGRTHSTVCSRGRIHPTSPRQPDAGWLVGPAHLHLAI